MTDPAPPDNKSGGFLGGEEKGSAAEPVSAVDRPEAADAIPAIPDASPHAGATPPPRTDASSRLASRSTSAASTLAAALGAARRPAGLENLVSRHQTAASALHGLDAAKDRLVSLHTGSLAGGGLVQLLQRQHGIPGTPNFSELVERHLTLKSTISAMGGMDRVAARYQEQVARLYEPMAALATRSGATANILQQASRGVAGAASLTNLLSAPSLDGSRTAALLAQARSWQQAPDGLSMAAAFGARISALQPERRLATASDIAAANLTSLGERFARDATRFARLREEMLGQAKPWVQEDDPGRSVAAYVDARALASVLASEEPSSGRVTKAVRRELGDYREARPVPDVVAADPFLRNAVRVDAGYDLALASLPTAVLAAVFGPRSVLGAAQPDEEALAEEVHRRVRRIELALRRFIGRKLRVEGGPKLAKGRVPQQTLERWRQRRHFDVENGREPGDLLDYADFSDYHDIISKKDNWQDLFRDTFKIKVAILETLRRLSLIRNPTAHFRMVTVEDLLDLEVEGRRMASWLRFRP